MLKVPRSDLGDSHAALITILVGLGIRNVLLDEDTGIVNIFYRDPSREPLEIEDAAHGKVSG